MKRRHRLIAGLILAATLSGWWIINTDAWRDVYCAVVGCERVELDGGIIEVD